MPRHYLILLLAFTALFQRLHGQSFDEANFSQYTKLDGLSQNYVTGIVQDSLGYLWVSTRKGLNRFDGKSFTNFFKSSDNSPLTENYILSLRINGNNELTGCTNGGAFSYNTMTGQGKKFVVPTDPVIFFWANWVFDAIKDARGNYILSTKSGLFVFDNKAKIICRYDHYLAADAGQKEIWFGGWLQLLADGKVFQQNSLSGSIYDPASNLVDTFFFRKKCKQLNYISPIKQGDTSSSFSSKADEAFFVNPGKNTIDIVNLSGNAIAACSLPEKVISDFDVRSKLFFIDDTTIALTSKIGGFYIFHYNPAEKKISGNGKKYFTSKYCTSILKDKDGRFWIGTDNGLYRQNLRNPFFSTEDISRQLPSIVNSGIQSVFADESHLFLGLRNDGGLLVVDKKTNKIFRRISFETLGAGSNNIVYIFSYDADTLWLGTSKGLIWLNKKDFSFGNLAHLPGQPSWMKTEKCRSFLRDSRGDCWFSFGRLNSVVLFSKARHRFIEITSPLLKITFCFSMCEDKEGNIWLTGDGLCRWNYMKQAVDTLIRYPSVNEPTLNFLETLAPDSDNNMWLLSVNEIIQYNLKAGQMQLRLPENNILDGVFVTSTPVIDKHIWICLGNAISVFNTSDYSIKQFNYTDGLPAAVATTPRKGGFYDTADNRFYFAAGPYLISFTPEVSLLYKRPVPKFFTEVIDENGKVMPPSGDTIQLSYSKNNLRVRFNSINFSDPEDNRYAYRIKDGTQGNWHEVDMQNTVGLTNLAEGVYNVQIKLSSINNHWPEQLRQLVIIIKPPFWKTWWFMLFGIACISLLTYWLYCLRLDNFRQRANVDKMLAAYEMKALHSQMNPHFIFNCLNSIKEMILVNDRENASRYLSRFAQVIRDTLEQSRQNFTSLRGNIDYIRRYVEMEQMRFEDFHFSVITDPTLLPDQIKIPPMLIQPLVENAIWHGLRVKKGEKKLLISFTRQNDKLACIIDDNGIGIKASLETKTAANQHASVGIDNVKKRIELLNEKYRMDCSMAILDKKDIPGSNGSGTVAKLLLPLETD